MKVQGDFLLPLDQQAAWNLLLDAGVLARAMPGCESLLPTGPDQYDMRMKIAVSSIRGLFGGQVRIEDKNPPASYRLVLQGEGKLGHLRGAGLLALSGEAESTRVRYDGEVQIGGLIASVGERMLDLTAKMMIRRFFGALEKEARAWTQAPAPSSGLPTGNVT